MTGLYGKFIECGSRVTTDSRKVSDGAMFFALKGENFDGNDFALKALEGGAGYAVVDSCPVQDPRIIHVENSLLALQHLAEEHRDALASQGCLFIGLTGTNGKTTTKELIRAALSTSLVTGATEGNLNNDIGVPLTLLGIKAGTQAAIVEMGASHPGDIERLIWMVKPDLGLITNVGRAHLLGFGSYEGVKRTKGELYDSLNASCGTAFVNTDDSILVQMAARRPDMRVIPYGLGAQGASVLPAGTEEPFLRISFSDGTSVHTQLVGAYNSANVLAALAVASHLGVPQEKAVSAIESYIPSNSRSQMVQKGTRSIVVDAYNANPSSMAASLDNFARIGSGRHIALLGDMGELGAYSREEHVGIVRKVCDLGLDAMFVGKEFSGALEEMGLSGRFPCFESSSALASQLEANPLPEDSCILVKGSHSTGMEKVVPSI